MTNASALLWEKTVWLSRVERLGRGGIVPSHNGRVLGRPPATERAYQLQGGNISAFADAQRGALTGEERGLLRLDLEVADDTRAILIHRDVQRALRRSRRGLLPLRFVLEQ